MAFYFSSVTKALYDTDVFPVASLPENKVEITEAAYTDLMTKQNQGYVILADGSGNPYTVNQSEATATDIKHASSVATTLALGHVKIGNTMTTANDGTLDVKDDAITADKVKDNETLPVNVSGSADNATHLIPLVHHAYYGGASGRYALLAQKLIGTTNNIRVGDLFRFFVGDSFVDFKLFGKLSDVHLGGILSNAINQDSIADRLHVTVVQSDGNYFVRIYAKLAANENRQLSLYQFAGQTGEPDSSDYTATWLPYEGYTDSYSASLSGTEVTYEWDRAYLYGSALYASKIGSYDSHPQVGSVSIPVYVDPNGQVRPCDPSQMTVGEASYSKKIGDQENHPQIGSPVNAVYVKNDGNLDVCGRYTGIYGDGVFLNNVSFINITTPGTFNLLSNRYTPVEPSNERLLIIRNATNSLVPFATDRSQAEIQPRKSILAYWDGSEWGISDMTPLSF